MKKAGRVAESSGDAAAGGGPVYLSAESRGAGVGTPCFSECRWRHIHPTDHSHTKLRVLPYVAIRISYPFLRS